jgi:subtilisin family serine protease
LVRSIFAESLLINGQLPSSLPEELAAAIVESIDAGARVLNLSVAVAQPSATGQHALEEALNYAARQGVILVAAAGNQASVGSSVITRHPWAIPVVACDLRGRPMSLSNLGRSIGRGGLSAPGDRVTSLGTDGKPVTSSGTSIAAPYVTGAVALLWSEFPDATAAEVKIALTQISVGSRRTVIPPLMDAWKAYGVLVQKNRRVR